MRRGGPASTLARLVARSVSTIVLVLALVTAASTLGFQRTAVAAVPRPPTQATAAIVLLAESVAPSRTERAQYEAIEDHVQSVGLSVVRPEPAGGGRLAQALESSTEAGVLGVFWIRTRPRSLTIYMYEPRAQGVFIRELERTPEDGDAALIEAVGLIVASTASALQEHEAGAVHGDQGEQAQPGGMRPLDADELAKLQPVARAEARPQSEAPSLAEDAGPGTTDVSRPNVGLRLLAAYLGDGFNRAAPWQSGARFGLGVLPHQRVRIDLAYGFVGPGAAGG